MPNRAIAALLVLLKPSDSRYAFGAIQMAP